jgi:hypothetical protein
MYLSLKLELLIRGNIKIIGEPTASFFRRKKMLRDRRLHIILLIPQTDLLRIGLEG